MGITGIRFTQETFYKTVPSEANEGLQHLKKKVAGDNYSLSA